MILGLTSCRPRALRSVVHLTAEQTAAQELQLMKHIGSSGWKVTCRNLVRTGCCLRALRPIVRPGSTSCIRTYLLLLKSCIKILKARYKLEHILMESVSRFL